MNTSRSDSASATLEPVRFGEFLLERQLITDEQWLAALAQNWSERLTPSRGSLPPGTARAEHSPEHRSGSVTAERPSGQPVPARRRRRIGATIVEAGYLSAEVVEAEARVFHDDLDVIEVSARSEKPTVPMPPVTVGA